MQAELMKQQYELIKGSRAVLLDYCGTISPENLSRIKPSFGPGSISYLLGHISNCYLFWIAETCLKREVTYIDYQQLPSFPEQRKLFVFIDQMMYEFFTWIDNERPISIQFNAGEFEGKASALELFTHATTHEFHHKGQILTLSRQLGYTPADTDIMR